MQQQTVPVNPNASVLVHAVHGDLRVAGWERNELMAKTSGSILELALIGFPVGAGAETGHGQEQQDPGYGPSPPSGSRLVAWCGTAIGQITAVPYVHSCSPW